jgi:hypothetical protein
MSKADCDPDLDTIDLVPCIRLRIRTEVNCWIMIRIHSETNADPKHCQDRIKIINFMLSSKIHELILLKGQ